jgi:hypothetical protein
MQKSHINKGQLFVSNQQSVVVSDPGELSFDRTASIFIEKSCNQGYMV